MRGAFSSRSQLVHQLVALQLVLAAEGVGVRALLDLAVLVAERREAGAASGSASGRSGCPAWRRTPAARRSKCMEASARLTPGLRRSSWSTASSTARLRSTGMEKGSMRQGETQVASYFSSGASATSPACAPRCRRGRSRGPARRRLRCRPCVRSSVAANPQQPKASTRIPTPSDSELDTWPALPFLVVTSRSRDFDGAHVGVSDAAARRGIQRAQGQVFHRGVIRPPSLSCSPEAVRGKRVE